MPTEKVITHLRTTKSGRRKRISTYYRDVNRGKKVPHSK